jgi:hypothetical protein
LLVHRGHLSDCTLPCFPKTLPREPLSLKILLADFRFWHLADASNSQNVRFALAGIGYSFTMYYVIVFETYEALSLSLLGEPLPDRRQQGRKPRSKGAERPP